MESFNTNELAEGFAPVELAADEFLRQPGFSMMLVRWAAGATDLQVPHREEEVYVVLAGRATLVTDAARRDVGGGDVIYLGSGEEHRFEEIVEDLLTLVVWCPPFGTAPAGAD
jgi:mannose-6-phosphate isomerase-like protein (cupin superfamily)